MAEGCSLSFTARHPLLASILLFPHTDNTDPQPALPVLEQWWRDGETHLSSGATVLFYFRFQSTKAKQNTNKRSLCKKLLFIFTWIFDSLLELLREPLLLSEAAPALLNAQPSSTTDSHWLRSHSKYFPESESEVGILGSNAAQKEGKKEKMLNCLLKLQTQCTWETRGANSL